MKLILRKNGVFYFSQNSFQKNQFTFGPEAFWRLVDFEHLLIHHIDGSEGNGTARTAFIQASHGNHRLAHDLKHLLKKDGYTFHNGEVVLIDYDEKVFWCNEFEAGTFTTWMSAWLEIFWPGWRIFIPEHTSEVDLLSWLGHKSPYSGLPLVANFLPFKDRNIFLKSAVPSDDNVEWLGVIDDEGLKFTPLDEFGLEALLCSGPSFLTQASLQTTSPDVLLYMNVRGVVDIQNTEFWTDELGYLKHLNISPDKISWPGWTIISSPTPLNCVGRIKEKVAPSKTALRKYTREVFDRVLMNFDFHYSNKTRDFENIFSGELPIKAPLPPKFVDASPPKEFVVDAHSQEHEELRNELDMPNGGLILGTSDESKLLGDDWDNRKDLNVHQKKIYCKRVLEIMTDVFVDKCSMEIWTKDRRPPSVSYQSSCPYNDNVNEDAYSFVYKERP